MFSRPTKNTEQRLLVRVVTPDRALEQRVLAALEPTKQFFVESLPVGLVEAEKALRQSAVPSLTIIELHHERRDELAALEDLIRAWPVPPRIIIITDGLAETAARKFLKLQISDWLPKHCSARDLLNACENVVHPAGALNGSRQARCIAYLPALGGVGNTTLSLATAAALSGKRRAPLASCCVVDLNLQAGSVADYLDLTPNLHVEEIAASPGRLDAHLLEVMLSRHRSGLAVLAAPPSLTGFERIDADLIGKLLNLASDKFEYVVIDMPRVWFPWCENIVRGSDDRFIVTQMTVSGLRQARRTADMLEHSFGLDSRNSVIVNRCPWLGRGGIKRRDALELLGERLAGFVTDCGQLVRGAQDRGVPLNEAKPSNRIETELRAILEASRKARNLPT
jgi:pilus assembly protein CpaE